MKYLGIDYGAKRVGIALSDDSGSVAFPHGMFPNDARLLDAVSALAREKGIGAVVMGESKDKDGNDNPVMEDARRFAARVEEALSIPVHFELEYYSSFEARRHADDSFVDARAAAVILNRYLERIRKSPAS